MVVAAISAVLLILHGSGDSRLIGLQGLGLSIRLDAVSVVMFLLVSFIGWVVVRYAATYLDGEARQGAFTGWRCMTLAAVLVLVLSGAPVSSRWRSMPSSVLVSASSTSRPRPSRWAPS